MLDEQTQGDGPKVARNFRMAYAATATLHDAATWVYAAKATTTAPVTGGRRARTAA